MAKADTVDEKRRKKGSNQSEMKIERTEKENRNMGIRIDREQ